MRKIWPWNRKKKREPARNAITAQEYFLLIKQKKHEQSIMGSATRTTGAAKQQ